MLKLAETITTTYMNDNITTMIDSGMITSTIEIADNLSILDLNVQFDMII